MKIYKVGFALPVSRFKVEYDFNRVNWQGGFAVFSTFEKAEAIIKRDLKVDILEWETDLVNIGSRVKLYFNFNDQYVEYIAEIEVDALCN